ncbi:PLP-dependent transferase [Chryseobacterium sp.]|uniref:phosphoketolase family protein n=1 Tax=Chryseobacterium sp. TaxID=1871047 RepID=UPI0028A05CA8|nr:PLP-dependent transferase [Chryseobacterium sp.]
MSDNFQPETNNEQLSNFETLAIRTQTERTQFDEHSTPLYLTSSFIFQDAEDMRASFAEEKPKNLYSRFSNPNVTEFTDKIAKMEGAEAGYAFATGMAAIYSTFATLLNAGDHLVCRLLLEKKNTLLCVADHCLKTWDRINVIVAGKQPAPQWLNLEAAQQHCAAGMGIWHWAGTVAEGEEPDVVMACAGDVPTMETLAAVDLLRDYFPDLRIQVVNVVDLMALQTAEQHPHGLSDEAFDAIFTADKPVIFAFHGYPSLIHRLTYPRNNHGNFHVRGFMEEGTTTTPFDMTVMNELDRFHLAQEAIVRTPSLQGKADAVLDELAEKIAEHHRYVREHGEDLPEVRGWKWPSAQGDGDAPE